MLIQFATESTETISLWYFKDHHQVTHEITCGYMSDKKHAGRKRRGKMKAGQPTPPARSHPSHSLAVPLNSLSTALYIHTQLSLYMLHNSLKEGGPSD